MKIPYIVLQAKVPFSYFLIQFKVQMNLDQKRLFGRLIRKHRSQNSFRIYFDTNVSVAER